MQKYCGCVFSEEERYHPKAADLGEQERLRRGEPARRQISSHHG